MGSVGEARCWHHWRNGESTSSVQGHKLPTPLCSYKILYGKAFPDHVYKLHLDFWRLRSSEEGRAKQEERDQPDQQISVAISSRAKKPCSVMWQAEQHRAGSRVADSSI